MLSSGLTFSPLRSDIAFALTLKINKSFTSRDTFQFSHPPLAPSWPSLPSDSPFPALTPPCFSSPGPGDHPKSLLPQPARIIQWPYEKYFPQRKRIYAE